MAVTFTNIPANVRVPLFYAEMDNSQANIFSPDLKVLLIGSKAVGGSATVDTPVLCANADQAIGLFGSGSMLHEMVAAYRLNDLVGEIWCLPTTDAAPPPSLTAGLAALGDEQYDLIALPWSDSTSTTALTTFMNDSAGRWSWSVGKYGHVYTVAKDTLANLQTLGGTLNDQHLTVYGLENTFVDDTHEYLAARVAQEAAALRAHQARPTHSLPLVGISSAPVGDRFTITEQQTLLTNGIATHYTQDDGTVRIGRSITTYQQNAFSQPDTSYLDSETMHQTARVLRELAAMVTSKFARVLLADDGTRFGSGLPIVTPKIAKGEIFALYTKLERLGYVENAALAAENTIVERAVSDPNRLNVLFAPDYVNQLRVFAVLNQFRLQYSPDIATV